MGAHLRNGRNISIEQQQRELQRREQSRRETKSPPESGRGDRPAGLQRGDDQRYVFSPAAAERLRKLREQSAVDYRHRYEATGGRSIAVGARNFTRLNQFQSDFFSARDDVQPIDSGTSAHRPTNFSGQYEYRDGPAGFDSDPSSKPSDPVSSPGTASSPTGRRHDNGQHGVGNSNQPVQRSVEHVCPSPREQQPAIDESSSHPSHLQPRGDPTTSRRSGDAPHQRELDSSGRTSRSREVPTSQPDPTGEPLGDNSDSPRAHSQPVPDAAAPFDTPTLGRHVPGYWPHTARKQPYASTPATVYSTPLGHSQAEHRTTSASTQPADSSSIQRRGLLPTTTSSRDDGSEPSAAVPAANRSRPELRAPTAPPPSTATKLERIWEELETPPRPDEQVTRSRGLSHESGEDCGQGVQNSRQRESERKGERTTPSTRRTPSTEPPH
ncbi:uncharacterized protein PGTG_01017 [Puccinia graminis f. sp. tritici CRL 75-36-700-3]|uniref:Uncharacterized protein n=1 Tax=Puccinia graminis f. sp. tritici (strain CRL 75-36-700-3 / race SCCL) TaxID=418459 RepID=E3JUG1_PUCGT|nr:uncharacterized protein PGTG_01017 [Puccinia graminis f. sp. tritici CRL 75-36-700-3]EFP75686.1 hypothetical protein PGTG_01017 [Puccinia graminis f. sp. tritici CRL 75-36-700-3]